MYMSIMSFSILPFNALNIDNARRDAIVIAFISIFGMVDVAFTDGSLHFAISKVDSSASNR